MRDARAALAYVRTRPDVDAARIGVMGMSLGGVFATRLAAEDADVRGVVVVAGFSTWGGVAGDQVPGVGPVLGPLLIPEGLEPRDSLREMGRTKPGRPVLLVHGDRDGIVSIRHAGVLEAAAREGGSVVERIDVPGAGHVTMLDGDAERARVAEFWERALAVPAREEGEKVDKGG